MSLNFQNIPGKMLSGVDTEELEWLESECPWQTLGTMFEVSQAVRSPNPEEYISHCPVHVDGSCNGMQHYAALGRDDNGGR